MILDDNQEQELVKCLREKLNNKNFCLHLTLSKTFCFSRKYALKYMDSWFMMNSETDNFLQLEVKMLEEIISRSSLLVTTEIEVYQVVAKWINYNFKEREKFSKKLLHKTRLPLLAEKTLKKILTEKSCFRENKESLSVVNDIMKGDFDFYKNKPSKFFTARYCGHDSFDILYFGGKKKTGEVVDHKILQINHSDQLESSEVISSLAIKRYNSDVVYLRGNVYIFGGFDGISNINRYSRHIVTEVEMYSHLTKSCKVVANIEDINEFDLMSCAICGFMDKIYLIGGFDENDLELISCIEFDTKDFSWKHKSEMHEKREGPAACVFEEKIIVSGGLDYVDDNDFVNFVNYYDNESHKTLNTVEAYEAIADTWTEFPGMNYSRYCHKSVVVKNKLFVIGGGTSINEVYDSTSKKFAILKPSFNLYDIRENYLYAAFKVSHNLFVYFRGSSNIFCFDTIMSKWSEKPSKLTEHLTRFSAIQVPQL